MIFPFFGGVVGLTGHSLQALVLASARNRCPMQMDGRRQVSSGGDGVPRKGQSTPTRYCDAGAV